MRPSVALMRITWHQLSHAITKQSSTVRNIIIILDDAMIKHYKWTEQYCEQIDSGDREDNEWDEQKDGWWWCSMFHHYIYYLNLGKWPNNIVCAYMWGFGTIDNTKDIEERKQSSIRVLIKFYCFLHWYHTIVLVILE